MEPVTPRLDHILCPTDLSEASTHAIELATTLARWYKGRITAQYVYTPMVTPIPTLPTSTPGASQADIQRAYDQTAASFRGAQGEGVQVDVTVDVGRPEVEILERAKALPADVIVMGTHGASGFERLVLGSVAEKVLRKAPCPVLTVPPRAQSTSVLPFKRLLCAVDFSEASLAGFELGCSMAQHSGAGLTLVNVLEWPWKEPPAPSLDALPSEQAAALAEYRRYLESGATRRLEAIIPEAVRIQCSPQIVIRHGKPYVEILRVAEEQRADLIVIGVRGRNPIDIALLGSTTNHVVRSATCPVLTLRQ
jgi:nucleotide-binding universal stress UspA family protein